MKISSISENSGDSVCLPRPIQLVIDDVGWWSGWDGNARQEPFRTGINRDHVLADYKAIIELGRALGIRPQAAMVLCEWDRENILRDLPDSTWMGTGWDNGKWVGPWLDEAADLIRSNPRHFEFTVHGIGHEHWSKGKLTRAEWSDKDGTMRAADHINRHLDYYERLMQQNGLGDFPCSFVPTAFNHGFGKTGQNNVSLAELLNNKGIDYLNTPFYKMQHAGQVENGVFGMDAGVLTIDRGNDLLSWNATGTVPEGELNGPTCGMHWPNLLHGDPERNTEIVQGWVDFLKPYNERFESMLARDSVHFQKQLLHHVCTNVRIGEERLELDFAGTDKHGTFKTMDELMVKFRSPHEADFGSHDLDIVSQSSLRQNSAILYTLGLKRKNSRTQASISFI